MAHQIDRSAVDALAAAENHTDPARPDAETTLAYGATGECVTQLVNLLKLLGYSTSSEQPTSLDEVVLADVRAAQQALGVTEPDSVLPSEIPVAVKGQLVGQATWNALYAAAEEKVAAELPATASQPASGLPPAVSDIPPAAAEPSPGAPTA